MSTLKGQYHPVPLIYHGKKTNIEYLALGNNAAVICPKCNTVFPVSTFWEQPQECPKHNCKEHFKAEPDDGEEIEKVHRL